MYGMEHIGFTVPDINEACDWFERILGAETLYTAATNFRHDDDDWMQEHLRVTRGRSSRNSVTCGWVTAPTSRCSSTRRLTRTARRRVPAHRSVDPMPKVIPLDPASEWVELSSTEEDWDRLPSRLLMTMLGSCTSFGL
jgi:hypothetical protein